MNDARALVLIVDDVAQNLALLGNVLQDDYRVLVATNGAEALELVARTPDIALILLDVMMPDLDGFEVCRRLRANTAIQEIPVIFVTARSEDVDEARGFAVGGVDYITKPISPTVVLARVKTHLTLRRLLLEARRQSVLIEENLRLRERFEQVINHDMRSPLTTLINGPGLLLLDPGLTEQQRRVLSLSKMAAYRLLDMVNRSLDLYRLEQGTYQLKIESVPVARLVDDVVAMLAEHANQRGVTCVCNPRATGADPGAELTLRAESLLVFSALTNVVKNAIEAAPAGSRVVVSWAAIAGGLGTIMVHNDGVIPPEVRDRFGQRYVTSGKAKGTGLGVYSARMMARAHGGDLTFVTDETTGTTVTLAFPLQGS